MRLSSRDNPEVSIETNFYKPTISQSITEERRNHRRTDIREGRCQADQKEHINFAESARSLKIRRKDVTPDSTSLGPKREMFPAEYQKRV